MKKKRKERRRKRRRRIVSKASPLSLRLRGSPKFCWSKLPHRTGICYTARRPIFNSEGQTQAYSFPWVGSLRRGMMSLGHRHLHLIIIRTFFVKYSSVRQACEQRYIVSSQSGTRSMVMRTFLRCHADHASPERDAGRMMKKFEGEKIGTGTQKEKEMEEEEAAMQKREKEVGMEKVEKNKKEKEEQVVKNKEED